MTISRTPDSLHGAVQAAIDWAGPEAAARAAGVTPARLRQVSNPNRRDADLAYVLVGIDAASARGGGGTPVFDWYMDQLSRAGSFGLSSQAAPVVSVRPLRSIKNCLPVQEIDRIPHAPNSPV